MEILLFGIFCYAKTVALSPVPDERTEQAIKRLRSIAPHTIQILATPKTSLNAKVKIKSLISDNISYQYFQSKIPKQIQELLLRPMAGQMHMIIPIRVS